MHYNIPERCILTIWRIELIILAIFPPFINSIIFDPWSNIWTIITAGWVFVFIFFYIVYFPIRYQNISFRITEEQVVLHCGVFFFQTRIFPVANIQFAGILSNPLERIWGITTLVLVSPGGRLTIPGLKKSNATLLLELIGKGDVSDA